MGRKGRLRGDGEVGFRKLGFLDLDLVAAQERRKSKGFFSVKALERVSKTLSHRGVK